MLKLKLVLILLLLLCGGSSFTMSASEIDHPEINNELKTQFSEDPGDLSPSYLSTSNFLFKNRLSYYSIAFLGEENSREQSRSKAYFLVHRFIEPGLSLIDIIYPFHIFL
ncbi:hypothetical protein RM549_09305 [Salegentibacter sp. F188]|uniref:Uncharacterized protein n=1 Tax=Autumnicola patrickiae TaxID=3075591 RepID=A0ABU3E1V5_9FLAO|nr:hypothetical protein [Salegentibacter sp. F188]MDT0689979.1 hypothetical protein [Salegentibacter sp. F188]